MDKLAVLRQYFGFPAFRAGQQTLIDAVLSGRDALGVMPTGGGKSLCYELPALLLPGMTLVVSPLISLMKDQVMALRNAGIPAGCINSSMSLDELRETYRDARYGAYKLLYVAPERLLTDGFCSLAQELEIPLVAVDEAHCISQWGYDFRPSYLRIAELRERLPEVPVLALTASATPAVARDIMRQLRFAEPHVLRSSFARPNLSYAVRHDEDKNEQLLRVVRNVAGSGIVYVRTRDGCEQLTEFLRDAGVAATCYHGGLANAERSIRQEEWLAGRTRIMVATNAFGMGIDKADVRFVVHYSMPDSLESYYQEAGRAGRDGKRAYAVLLVAPDDAERVQRRFDLQFPPLDEIRDIYEKVCSYLQIGIGDGEQASFVFNIHDFCAKFRLFGGKVASALKLLQQNGYLTLTDEMRNPARILFCISRDDLYKLRVVRNDLDHFIRTVLRLYDGVFTDFRPIDEQEIAAASGYKVEHVKELFKRLWQMRVIRYIPANQAPMLFFDCERLPAADLYIAPETYRRRQELAEERFSHMIAYAANETECRSTVLERYFGAADPAPCGVCDICLAARKRAKSAEAPLDEEILRQLDAEPLAVKELAARFRCDAERVLEAVERLQHAGKISTAESGKLAINR